MKKIYLFVITCILVCFGALALTACGEPKLPVPENFSFNEAEQKVSWDAVPNAIRYTLEVNGKEESTRSYVVNFANRPAGRYKVRVKALGDGETYADSDWSKMLEFTKDPESGLIYRLIDNNTAYEVSGIGNAPGDVVIDSVYRKLPVTRIADAAFSNTNKLTSIVIPDSITSIGNRAFYNCVSLQSITIANSVTSIGNYAFQRCSALTEITLPEGLTHLSNYAFASCSALTTVHFGSKIESIGDFAFSNASSLKISTTPGNENAQGIVIPDSVKTLGNRAFYQCTDITSVKLGSGVTKVGEYAFANNTSLKSLELGDATEEIGQYSFFRCTSLTDIDMGGLMAIGAYSFSECTALTSVTVADTVVIILNAAFKDCKLLNDVKLGNGLETMGLSVFEGTKLYEDQVDLYDLEKNDPLIYIDGWLVKNLEPEATDVIIKDGTKGIASQAFVNWGKDGVLVQSSLSEITIPDSVKYINDYAFYYCDSLTSVDIGDGVVFIGNYAFYHCELLHEVRIGRNVKAIGLAAFYQCLELEIVDFTDSSVETLNQGAFWGCIELKEITLPDTVIALAGEVFAGCTALESIYLGNKLESIGSRAFANCLKLGSIELPDTIREIGTQTFYNSGLFSYSVARDGVVYAGNWVVGYVPDYNTLDGLVTIRSDTVGIAKYSFTEAENLKTVLFAPNPDGTYSLRNLGYAAFYKCSTLEDINLPVGITEIPGWAFYGCAKLKYVTIPEGVTIIGEYAFNSCASIMSAGFGLKEIVIPSTVEEIGKAAFGVNSDLTSITITDTRDHPSQLRIIDDFAFRSCTSVTAITIPASVVSLGAHVFDGCRSLGTVLFTGTSATDTVEAHLESIGAYAFGGMNKIQSMTIPYTVKYIAEYAFYYCWYMEELRYGNGLNNEKISLETIGHHAFYGCPNLRYFNFPKSIKSIGDQAFRNDFRLESVVLGNNIEEIGQHVFYGCTRLTIYAEMSGAPEAWSNYWNSSRRPIIWNCTLDEYKIRVISITMSAANQSNFYSSYVLMGPRRRGYMISGWTTNLQSNEAVYNVYNIKEAMLKQYEIQYQTERIEEIEAEASDPNSGGMTQARREEINQCQAKIEALQKEINAILSRLPNFRTAPEGTVLYPVWIIE